jgi:hypothetical protein
MRCVRDALTPERSALEISIPPTGVILRIAEGGSIGHGQKAPLGDCRRSTT